MNVHEEERESHDSRVSGSGGRDAIKRLSPDFHALSLDIQEVMQQGKDPAFLAALMFKLVQEREQTNKLLDQINEKYDRLMFELKTSQANGSSSNPVSNPAVVLGNAFQVLPEQDQMILNTLDQKGSLDAHSVQQLLGYKGLNAACQRLNKLCRDGHVKKVQSGKHVLFVPNR